ncbi:DUF2238 domain-containing protein [Streptomyces sp. NBC_00038]|uniref:DUF2238 domain-containing protein n=1 Tax=Streptomyces sp. NBC_00038 TaxID=2903615 RepID=UPI00225B2A8A|nr:DUF2238 domain-containing protein [Streptomyces sp. NBC_00038]MCX5563191.1 DUF2238 domain-containing protein [Streptomyces sp. NBC_00038]
MNEALPTLDDPTSERTPRRILPVVLVVAVGAGLAVSAWHAHDGTAVIGGHAADDFLATQGDVWDTHWDMFCALIGATVSVLLLSRLHDRQLGALSGAEAPRGQGDHSGGGQ